MSFSSEIKKQLCAVKELSEREMTAMLYGMFFAGKSISGKPAVRTENLDIFTAAQWLCARVFKNEHYETRRLVKNGGSLYTLSVKSDFFGDFSRVNEKIVSGSDDSASAFLRGIFVCCGYVTNPQKEYHLELVLPDSARAGILADFISEHGMFVKTTERKSQTVLYSKTSEQIEDFLTYIGAGTHSLEIMQVKIEKDLRNRANRSVNCDSANLDKTVAASEKSCRDIELVLEEIGTENLSRELRETALLRLNNRESSLSELCAMFEEPISRSGLNHRLKKLSALAKQIREGKSEQ